MKINLFFFIMLAVSIVGNSSCKQKQPKKKDAENWDVENTKMVESYDEVNSVAIKNAQDSLGLFIKIFSAKQNGDNKFYIKSEFRDEKNIENMWSIVNSIEGDSLSATLDNVPLKLTNIKLDDKIKIAKKDVQDWTINKGDSLLMGNFMERNHKIE